MSVADRFVTEYMPTWLRRHKKPEAAISPATTKKVVRRPALAPRPTVAFKPKPLNPEQYSTHL
jgi:hypothetical protein